MKYDRQIKITVGSNRKSMNWQQQTLLLSEFYARLQIPARSTETMVEYLKLTKAAQDNLKDIGGFVAGTLSGTRRKADAITGRDLITLDFDNIPAGGTESILKQVDDIGCGYCIYSTRKHTPSTPRLRILLPFDRTATADEYEPIARYMASVIGIECADPTTFEASRLMYWASCCVDSEYVFKVGDKPLLSVDEMLATLNKKYGDWHDATKWEQVPGSENLYQKPATKQSDPLAKNNIIGAFCRAYDIYSAMENFLPGVYEETTTPGRYTYCGGSTTSGAIIYEDGKFLYSHHASDPCCGKLVNAFDLVRLHKFGNLDDDVDIKTPTNRLPSYYAMSELAANDAKVLQQLAKADFEHVEENTNWKSRLELNGRTGSIKSTMDNVWLILENDPNLKGKFALNEFSGRAEILGDLPWSPFVERRAWSDNDNQGLYWYFEKFYRITGNMKIDGALSLHSEKHKFNEVKNYLLSLTWDRVPRLDTLLIDYLGAKDCNYVRAVTRKAFTAVVARAMEPGCKYDTMLILSGRQGLGKSLLLDKMSMGWFNDTIRTFEGKEASELLQGVWLVEIGELDAFRRTDVARIKQFLSQRFDRFRASYGRHVQELPRRCVFFGTTNAKEFLSDRTGNRRFWVVDVGDYPRRKKVWEDLDKELDQIWAEAVLRWRLGERLYLIDDEEETATLEQNAHRETNGREGVITEFLDKPIPKDWVKWSLDNRRIFWASSNHDTADLVERDRVCALEIWCEALGGQIRDFKRNDAQEINDILRALPDWEKIQEVRGLAIVESKEAFSVSERNKASTTLLLV